MPKIFVLTGPDVGQSFDVQSGAVFGRADDCAVRLHDASVSRRHARLEQTVAGWSLVDLGSRNGLFLDGARLERVPLEEATDFRLGEVVLRFRASSPAADAPPPAVTPQRAPASEADEIVLEGDWDESKASATPAVTAFTPRAAGGKSLEQQLTRPTAAEAPSLARQQAAQKLAALGVTARGGPAGSRGILQYQKVEARSGLLQADFDQYPLWQKALIGLGVIVACALFAWLAFRAVLMVRGTTQGAPTLEDDTNDGG
ncbi:MAG: FHA domain-containing protein [Planctomycetes bacterium]|nr:FHA domain-containing protein [Planctomycetota bacterium]